MKRNLALVLAFAIGLALYANRTVHAPPAGAPPAATDVSRDAASGEDSLRRAIDAHAQDVPVEGRGSVLKLLPDDRQGSPHQRILLRVAGGGTVLVAHNLDLAPRLAPLAVGDEVEFAGDYVWNDKGGLVHWTHPDPQGRHRAGWLRRVDAR